MGDAAGFLAPVRISVAPFARGWAGTAHLQAADATPGERLMKRPWASMKRTGVLVLVAACWFAAGGQARGSDGNDGSPDPHYGLGQITVFLSEAEAARACAGDPVVWAERNAGFFYMKDEDKYARSPQGAFACKSEAMKSNYWGTSLMESIQGYHGKDMKWDYVSS